MSKRDIELKSDEELMEAYKLGDTLAFEILFKRHSGRVTGFLTKKLNGKKDVQDILQEVFFKLHRSKHLYNSTLPFSPWIFSISRSVLLDYFKKQKFEDATEGEVIEKLAFQNEVPSLLDKESLEILPPLQKQAVGMRVYDDASFDEIASKLSTTPENARQLVSRGIKKLRETFGRKE